MTRFIQQPLALFWTNRGVWPPEQIGQQSVFLYAQEKVVQPIFFERFDVVMVHSDLSVWFFLHDAIQLRLLKRVILTGTVHEI